MVIKELPKMYDIDGLNKNFTLTLPFKNLNLSTNSEVCERFTQLVERSHEYFYYFFFFFNFIIFSHIAKRMMTYVNSISGMKRSPVISQRYMLICYLI